MIKSEKVLMFLLISICLLVTIIMVDALVDPAILIATVFASNENTSENPSEDIFNPSPEEVSLLLDGWEIFRSEGYAFEIQIPNKVVQKSLLNQGVLNTGIGVLPEAPVWEFDLDDPSLSQGTNLLDASLVIHVLQGEEQVAACSQFQPGSQYTMGEEKREQLPTVEINGRSFWKDQVIEGVMGEFYQKISYRTASNGACYQLTQLIHYQNIESLNPDEITGFNEEQVIAHLDTVLATFTLLDIVPTFPEQSYPLPKLVSSTVAKSTSGNVDGLDVSHWQGDINWAKVHNNDYVFTFVKATEGVGWLDVKFLENINEGTAAGVKMGAYHFARPNLGNTGAEEAEYFLSQVGDYLESGYLRPVLDLEVGSSLGRTALSAWVLDWYWTVKNRTGVAPQIYTNLNYVNNYFTNDVTEFDLWIAYWNCDPSPTFTIPPTGRWGDWAFWQYCVGNAGTVPGITTRIDMNIFNGEEAGLSEYFADSTLWVSLSNYTIIGPAPHYADLKVNVYGDGSGPMDIALWWNCTELGSDLTQVSGICGALPVPGPGQCVKNEIGMQCLQTDSETLIGEHTYRDVGDFTAKVIVKRGGAAPVEDRFKLTTFNPLRSTEVNPSSPGTGIVSEPYLLNGAAEIRTSVGGAFQMSVIEVGSGETRDVDCQSVGRDVKITKNFNLSWTESAPGTKQYSVWTQYRPLSECPIEDTHVNDLSQNYQIVWESVNPILVLTHPDGEPVPAGSTDDLGDHDPYQNLSIDYTVYNPSTANSFQITAGTFGNLVNIQNPQLSPAGTIVVGPDQEVAITVSFDIENTGPFSFDVALEHDATNSSPYNISIQGNGVLTSNPIQSVNLLPLSPGQNFIGEPYSLQVGVELIAPASGALQVSAVNLNGGTVQDSFCQAIPSAGQSQQTLDLSWTESEVGDHDYTIWTRYRALGDCPISDSDEYDLSQNYQIIWEDDSPVLEINNPDGISVPAGSSDDVGNLEPYQTVELEYILYNPSVFENLQITEGVIENNLNVLNPQLVPSGTTTVGPGEEIPNVVSFEIENTGPFSFDLALEHDASNPTPYSFTIEGAGALTNNPVQSVNPLPTSPGQKLIGEPYSLQVGVEIDAPAIGALQVSVVNQAGELVQNSICQAISSSGVGQHTFGFTWVESNSEVQDYTIWTRYRGRAGCPIEDTQTIDISQSYQVNWLEDSPILELQKTDGTLIPTGDSINIGQFEYYQSVELNYLIHNTSTTSHLRVADIRIENLVNLNQVNVIPSESLEIDPESTQSLAVSFQLENTGPFKFDLVLDHEANNPSPYRVTIEGSAVITNNPINYIVPAPSSPGTSLIGTQFPMDVEVGTDLPEEGALQVSLVELGTGVVQDRGCQILNDNLNQARNFNLSWTRSVPGNVEYSIWTRYRAQGNCPIDDERDSDLSMSYKVNWEEDIPVLELQYPDGSLLPPGSNDNIGQVEFYQQVDLEYIIHNPSTTSNMQVAAITVENLINLSSVDITPAGPVTIGPEGDQMISGSFLVNKTGPFAFDIKLDHDASNTSPYRITVQGAGVMTNNPIQGISTDPASPGTVLISNPFSLQGSVETDMPAPGVLEVSLIDQSTGNSIDQSCTSIPGVGESTHDFEFSWTEDNPADVDYTIQARYQVEGICPIAGDHDAELSEGYQVSWQDKPLVLEVKRPEGVSIFDGTVDYIGEHDFFRFVEVTYVIENNTTATIMEIENITAENLVNLRNVTVEPAGPFEIGPGEGKTIVVSFQVLVLEPYSFDLLWEHNASNPSPYKFEILGDANLYLGDITEDSWLYDYVISLIEKEFFLNVPQWVLDTILEILTNS